VAALNGRPKAASDSVQLGHHGESGAGEGVRGGPTIQLQQLLPGILVRRPRLPQGPVRFGRVLPLPRPGDLLRRVQRLHSHPCTVTLALPGWNSLDVCMYVFIATALTVGFFMRFFFLSGYFSNYFCSRHDNHDIVIISGPTEAVSVLFSFLFS